MTYTDFLDPEPPQFTGDTLLERISRAVEDAVNAAGDAYDEEADAENLYLLEKSKAWAYATEDKVAISARSKHCDNQPDVVVAHMAWNRAIAKRKRCTDKADELERRQMASMSHQKFVGGAT